MYPVDKTVCASVSHMKKRESEKEVTVSLFVGLPFIWFSLEIYSFFLLDFFFSLKKCFISKGLDKWSQQMFRLPWCTSVYLCGTCWALCGVWATDPAHPRQKRFAYREQRVSAPQCRQDPSSTHLFPVCSPWLIVEA